MTTPNLANFVFLRERTGAYARLWQQEVATLISPMVDEMAPPIPSVCYFNGKIWAATGCTVIDVTDEWAGGGYG